MMPRAVHLAIALCLALGLAMPGPAQAQSDAVAVARNALQTMEQAKDALTKAERASDRVAALTQTVAAYESGLAALRDGMRQISTREAVLTRALGAERERVSRLLGALESMQGAPEALLLLHPSGPADSVRSAMMLAEITPALNADAEALALRLDELRLIRILQASALDTLAQGLAAVQEARTQLSLAISNRTDLPRRFAGDSDALAGLLDSAATLQSFVEGLGEVVALAGGAEPAAVAGPRRLPVAGRILRGFAEADAAGIARPGVIIATAPRALVTTPVAATIRYLGPLLDYGNVMILEPDPDTLLVLAGLDQVYGDTGTVIEAGSPVGLMGGAAPTSQEFLAEANEDGGAGLTETLYLELRRRTQPVDPMAWFAETKDENR